MKAVRHEKYHGRVSGTGRQCAAPGCDEPGEFRAPGERLSGYDGPGDYRWFCLEHVRAFNAGYDWFDGMSADEIFEAQHPVAGWRSESPTFRATAGIDSAPRWAEFADPLEAISARARAHRPAQRADGRPVSPEQRQAFATMDLPTDADRASIRKRYLELVQKLHPDRNGGDRRHEERLKSVIEAYQLLRASSLVA